MLSEEMASEQVISDEEYAEATQRGQEMLRTLPRALGVHFNSESRQVEVKLSWGYSIHFPPERAQELGGATDAQLANAEVTGVGFGIYFPDIDADFSVPGLVKGRFGNDAWERAWAEMHHDRSLSQQQAA